MRLKFINVLLNMFWNEKAGRNTKRRQVVTLLDLLILLNEMRLEYFFYGLVAMKDGHLVGTAAFRAIAELPTGSLPIRLREFNPLFCYFFHTPNQKALLPIAL